MEKRIERHDTAPFDENISGTLSPTLSVPPAFVIADSDLYNFGEQNRRARCSFVLAENWRYGEPDPFCGAPARPGSSYCARHQALCAVARDSDAAARILADQAHAAAAATAAPDDLAPSALPEAVVTEPEEAFLALDLPRAGDEA